MGNIRLKQVREGEVDLEFAPGHGPRIVHVENRPMGWMTLTLSEQQAAALRDELSNYYTVEESHRHAAAMGAA
jgi:hypothetical protein